MEVVLIHHPEGAGGTLEGRPAELPAADSVLGPGDRLLVLARPESIKEFQTAGRHTPPDR